MTSQVFSTNIEGVLSGGEGLEVQDPHIVSIISTKAWGERGFHYHLISMKASDPLLAFSDTTPAKMLGHLL